MSKIKFDQTTMPTFEEMLGFSGKSGKHWLELEKYLIEELGASKNLQLPWNGEYGWAMRYKIKSKQVCDIFPEKEAFCLYMRIKNQLIDDIITKLGKEAKSAWEAGYPCKMNGVGGRWLSFDINKVEHLKDAIHFINAKMGVK